MREKARVNYVSCEELFSSINKLSNGCSLNQIINCVETGLFCKMFPGRGLTAIHSDPCGIKKPKERVTINVCSNASGSIKLPLLLIGKVKKSPLLPRNG